MKHVIPLILLLGVSMVLVSCSNDEITNPPESSGLVDQASIDDLDKGRGGNNDPGIIPPHARPGGKSYAEWSELWWQWMASAPALPDENPVLDSTGDLIDYGQSGSVWFLAGCFEPGVVREATIPTGKMLYVGLSACTASTWEGLGDTEEELRASAAACADLINVTSFVIDDTEVPIGLEYRIQSEGMFSLTVPEDNVFDFWGFPAPAGTYYPLVADGYYAMLAPLSAGDHTIVIAWTFLDFGGDVTIHLHVEGGQH